MPTFRIARGYASILLMLGLGARSAAQVTTIPFTSGPIPLCDTSTFTADVFGVGQLSPPGTPWSSSMQGLTINITSDHPQTLQIFLTSPQGTVLSLSEFNGAGGQNYTECTFTYAWSPSITTGTAPFTGSWTPQGGPLSIFDYQIADGIWTITVIDTSCVNGGSGQGGDWTPGWFDGSTGTGGFAFGFEGPPPCWGGIPGGTSYICPGESVDILSYYAMFGYDISVMLNWVYVADPTAVTEPGSYEVDAMDMWGGCWYTAMYDVIAYPEVALGPDQMVSVCDGSGPVDLTALFTLGGATPDWSLDGTPITVATAAAATTPGVYQLIGQSGGNCGSDTATVTLNVTAGVQLGPDASVSICDGASTDLSVLYATGGLVADWSLGGAPFATPEAATAAGVYTLTASTVDGCTDMAYVTLTVEAPPDLGADQAIALCSNASVDLTAMYSTQGLVSAWTLSEVTVADPSAVNGDGSYRLVVLSGAGCADTAFVSVSDLAVPALGADAEAAVCAGEAVDLTSYYTTAGLTTEWTLSGTAVPDPTSVDVTGQYRLIATNTACSDTAQVSVTVYALPVLGADQSITRCDGQSVDLTALYSTGADATAWTRNGAIVSQPEATTEAGPYTLTVTNAAGCSATAEVTLAFNPSPDLGADQSASICAGTTFDLASVYFTTGLDVDWRLNGLPVNEPTSAHVTGDYRLVATNDAGCSDTAVVSLLVNPPPDLGTDLSFSLCPWQTVDLSAVFPTAGFNTSYTLDGVTVEDPLAVYDPGHYLVTVTDESGCSDEAVASITDMECMCVADFTDDAKCIQEPVKFTLLADSAVLGAHWEFSGTPMALTDIDPLVQLAGTEEVVVTLRVMLSCGEVTVERTIHVPDCSDSCTVWIPTAFTPNGDGRNETWTWSGGCWPEDFSMEVFDRWGEIVFTTKDPLNAWDGTYGGALCPPGVFVYRAGYRLPYQKRKEVKGTVSLIR